MTFADGSLVQLRGLLSRPELNGHLGLVHSWKASSARHKVIITAVDDAPESMMLKPENLVGVTTQPLRFETNRHGVMEMRTLFRQRDELQRAWQQYGHGLAHWWNGLTADGRRSVLGQACPDIRENMELEQNLVPECCMAVLADKPCASKSHCEHGPPLRLLHDLHAAATMDPIRALAQEIPKSRILVLSSRVPCRSARL